MKAIYILLTGLLLIVLTVVAPILILKFRTDPRNPDAAEMEACCVPIPLAVLSFLFVAVGINRLIYERRNKDSPSIAPPEE